LCIGFQQLEAQTYSISGKVIDKKNNESLELISIRILSEKDSTYIGGTATNEDGLFSIKVNPAQYLVHVSSLGYLDQFVKADTRKGNFKVSDIYLSENTILLDEAVVTAKAVEITVKEDTLEYNADSYKVQETAVVEDMIKKMPGVMIDENGIVTVNGKEVKKFLIDGKEFFTDDPRIALKNLPAKMIDKLQVIDQKSEMARMTGFADGEEETVINLTIKPGMKKSLFGDVTAGYGSDDKYGLRGMANYMDDITQMSVLVGTNNTNNIGFSDAAADIYAGGRPPGGMDFGGNNGLTKSINSGLNFAREYTKTRKISGDVSYGTSDNDVTTSRSREYTGTDRHYTSTAMGNNGSKTLKANLRFEWSFDELTRIIVRPRMQYVTNDNRQNANAMNVIESDSLNNTNVKSNNSFDANRYLLGGTVTFSRRFKKKGRNITLSLTGTINNTERDGLTYSETKKINTTKKPSIIDQYYTQDDKNSDWRVNFSYVEPLGRNYFLQLKYNIQNKSSITDKKTYVKENPDDEEHNTIAPNFTRKMDNDFLNQNISLNLRSTRKTYNYVVGLGIEPSSSKTDITLPDAEKKDVPRKNFLSFSPSAEFNYIWNKRHNLRVEYRSRTIQASTQQLYDGIISQSGSDSLRGNPNLRPRVQSNVGIRYQRFNSKRASMLIVRGEFNHVQNDIVTISTWEGSMRSRTYENINGNMDANLRIIYNTPLKNKKLSINTNTYGSIVKRNTYINADKSETAGKNTADVTELKQYAGIRFNSDLFDFDVRANISYRDTRNSLSKDQDQEIFNYGGYGNLTFYLPYNFLLSNDIQYSANSGYQSQFSQKEWLWNITFSKEIFKKKNGIIRLNIYDLLQERSNIRQRSTADYMEYTTTNTIDSYFMLNFVYKFNIHNAN